MSDAYFKEFNSSLMFEKSINYTSHLIGNEYINNNIIDINNITNDIFNDNNNKIRQIKELQNLQPYYYFKNVNTLNNHKQINKNCSYNKQHLNNYNNLKVFNYSNNNTIKNKNFEDNKDINTTQLNSSFDKTSNIYTKPKSTVKLLNDDKYTTNNNIISSNFDLEYIMNIKQNTTSSDSLLNIDICNNDNCLYTSFNHSNYKKKNNTQCRFCYLYLE